MKKLSLFILLILLATTVSGQKEKANQATWNWPFGKGDTISRQKEKPNPSKFYQFAGDTSKPAKEYEIDYIRYCLNGYHKERQTGIILQFVGIGLGIAGSATYGRQVDISIAGGAKTGHDFGTPFLVAGGLTGLAGFIIMLDAEKWTKRSAIRPASSGMGVRVYFNRPARK
jgi:hypothetical protein